MLAFHRISLVLLLAILHICLSYPSIRIRECRGCGKECHLCIYGSVMSSLCGIPECRKGPNEGCGGVEDYMGICGDGMRCQCNRCTGCSMDTFECAKENPDEPCRPRDSGMNGYWDPLRGNRFTLVQ